jgi:hypothetical protein
MRPWFKSQRLWKNELEALFVPCSEALQKPVLRKQSQVDYRFCQLDSSQLGKVHVKTDHASLQIE